MDRPVSSSRSRATHSFPRFGQRRSGAAGRRWARARRGHGEGGEARA
jgi:hypothetical protein